MSTQSTTITAYQLIKGLNKILSDLGVEKVLPTQMGYTYTKKGMVDGIKGTHNVTQEAANTWYQKYLTKNGYITEVQEEVDPNQLTLDV